MSGESVSVPRRFLVEVDSLLSWIAHRGILKHADDRETAIRLSSEARSLYENPQDSDDQQQSNSEDQEIGDQSGIHA